MKTVQFYTLGCKVNQYETQYIREKFINCGFKEVEDGIPSDIYLINTCTVTHRADSESLSFIRRAKKENPTAKVIVTGCLVELDGDRIKQISSDALIIKNKDKEDITRYLFSYGESTSQSLDFARDRRVNGHRHFLFCWP